MTTTKLSAALAAALAVAGGCGMKMNGKTVGFGGSDGTASASPDGSGGGGGGGGGDDRASGEVDSSGDPNDPQSQGMFKNMPRYPEAPNDPWLGIEGDQPKRMDDSWGVRPTEFKCTAVHDHCIDQFTWWIEIDSSRDGKPTGRRGDWAGIMLDGVPRSPHHSRSAGQSLHDGKDYTAYKTVPATKRNLEKGATVIVLQYPVTTPTSGAAVFDDLQWEIGTVDHVEWDINKVYLVGAEEDSLAIAGGRVAVLSWRPGGKVAILGGKSRDEIKVKASEVILPDPKVQ